MNWTAISGISQLVVALGVILSMFDLTKQLRESNARPAEPPLKRC